MSMVAYKDSVQRGREAVLKEDLFRMRDAIDQYYADRSKYPQTLEDLVSTGYLRKVPIDPITQSSESWQLVQAEPDPNNLAAEVGIYDIKSGSEGTALDGSKYADW
jgi:general secretion pathway protein G